MRKMKLTIVSVFAAILIVAGWGVTNNMSARVTSHHVSGEMYQSDGESCSNPKIHITGTSSELYVDALGSFEGYVDSGSTLTFSADGCRSLISDPIISDIEGWQVELQPSDPSGQAVKFIITLNVAK